MPVSLADAWMFFSNPHNLSKLTPSFLNLKVINNVFGNEIYPGQVMLYKVKPFLGLSVTWMTEITHVQKEKMFVDEQRKGPYALWHHQHHFKAIEGGVKMTDVIHYRLPFGLIGNLFHGRLVKKKLEQIFLYRYEKVKELFGDWKNDSPNINID